MREGADARPHPGPQHERFASKPCDEIGDRQREAAVDRFDVHVVGAAPQLERQRRRPALSADPDAGQVLVAEIPGVNPVLRQPVPVVRARKKIEVDVAVSRQRLERADAIMRADVRDEGEPHAFSSTTSTIRTSNWL